MGLGDKATYFNNADVSLNAAAVLVGSVDMSTIYKEAGKIVSGTSEKETNTPHSFTMQPLYLNIVFSKLPQVLKAGVKPILTAKISLVGRATDSATAADWAIAGKSNVATYQFVGPAGASQR